MLLGKCGRIFHRMVFRKDQTFNKLHACYNTLLRPCCLHNYCSSTVLISPIHSFPLPTGQMKHMSLGAGLLNRSIMDPVAYGFQFQPVRHKSRGRSKKSGKGALGAEDDEDSDNDDEDDDDDNEDDFGRYFDEDEDLPNNHKELKKYLKSLRIDAIVSGGLNIARNKVDDYFLGSKLRHNGERVHKKGKQMAEGDYVDLISEVVDDQIKVKRVRIVRVLPSRTKKDRLTVLLRAWRTNVLIDKYEADEKW